MKEIILLFNSLSILIVLHEQLWNKATELGYNVQSDLKKKKKNEIKHFKQYSLNILKLLQTKNIIKTRQTDCRINAFKQQQNPVGVLNMVNMKTVVQYTTSYERQ